MRDGAGLRREIGLAVRRHRDALGWTQAALAKAAHVAQTTLSRLERPMADDVAVDEASGVVSGEAVRAGAMASLPMVADVVHVVMTGFRQRGWTAEPSFALLDTALQAFWPEGRPREGIVMPPTQADKLLAFLQRLGDTGAGVRRAFWAIIAGFEQAFDGGTSGEPTLVPFDVRAGTEDSVLCTCRAMGPRNGMLCLATRDPELVRAFPEKRCACVCHRTPAEVQLDDALAEINAEASAPVAPAPSGRTVADAVHLVTGPPGSFAHAIGMSVVHNLRLAGLLLEPGQRAEIVDLLMRARTAMHTAGCFAWEEQASLLLAALVTRPPLTDRADEAPGAVGTMLGAWLHAYEGPFKPFVQPDIDTVRTEVDAFRVLRAIFDNQGQSLRAAFDACYAAASPLGIPSFRRSLTDLIRDIGMRAIASTVAETGGALGVTAALLGALERTLGETRVALAVTRPVYDGYLALLSRREGAFALAKSDQERNGKPITLEFNGVPVVVVDDAVAIVAPVLDEDSAMHALQSAVRPVKDVRTVRAMVVTRAVYDGYAARCARLVRQPDGAPAPPPTEFCSIPLLVVDDAGILLREPAKPPLLGTCPCCGQQGTHDDDCPEF